MPDVLRNPKYDGLMVLLPDVSHLRSGDIFLTFNAESKDSKGSKQSSLIRCLTGGHFSHALICSVPPTMIEAIGTGVSTLSLARCFVHKLDNVRVLRLPEADIAAKAAGLAQMEVGRDYSIPKAISSVFSERMITNIKDNGTFCSALIAQVFSSAGATIFLKTSIEKTTPATLEHLDGLKDITTNVFREALAPSNIEQMCALDGDRIFSPSQWQTEINNRYAKILVPVANGIVCAYPAAGLNSPTTFFQVIQFIMDASAKSSKIGSSQRSAYNAVVENLDAQTEALMISGELSTVFDKMMEADSESDLRNLAESFKAHPDIDRLAMQSYFETSITQIEKRRDSIQGFVSWEPGRSRAVQAYIDLQSIVLKAMQLRIVLIKEILARIG